MATSVALRPFVVVVVFVVVVIVVVVVVLALIAVESGTWQVFQDGVKAGGVADRLWVEDITSRPRGCLRVRFSFEGCRASRIAVSDLHRLGPSCRFWETARRRWSAPGRLLLLLAATVKVIVAAVVVCTISRGTSSGRSKVVGISSPPPTAATTLSLLLLASLHQHQQLLLLLDELSCELTDLLTKEARAYATYRTRKWRIEEEEEIADGALLYGRHPEDQSPVALRSVVALLTCCRFCIDGIPPRQVRMLSCEVACLSSSCTGRNGGKYLAKNALATGPHTSLSSCHPWHMMWLAVHQDLFRTYAAVAFRLRYRSYNDAASVFFLMRQWGLGRPGPGGLSGGSRENPRVPSAAGAPRARSPAVELSETTRRL